MGHNRARLVGHVGATFGQYQVIFSRICKIFSMDTLELCGDILQPGGQLETPGLVILGPNIKSQGASFDQFQSEDETKILKQILNI